MNDVTGEVLALSDDWLSQGPVVREPDVHRRQLEPVDAAVLGANYVYSYSWPTYTRIRLKLSEVLYLRKKARQDKKLRKILQQFTGHIEIEVDF